MSARPRWKIEESSPCPVREGDTTTKAHFITRDGQEFSVIATPEVIDTLIHLPYSYVELGNKAADMSYDISKLQIAFDNARGEIDALRQRIDAMGDEAIVPILAEDLEKVLNLAIRWAFALGIQGNADPNSLYGQLQSLAHKYKMHYTPPKDYNYHEMILPLPVSSYELEKNNNPVNHGWLIEDDDGDPS